MASREDFLPGIEPETCPPIVVVESRFAVAQARRRAALRDALQLILLFGVDWLFVHWPYSHVPFIDRSHSVLIVVILNVALLTHVILSRAFPRWSARRIAATWNLSERARFFQR